MFSGLSISASRRVRFISITMNMTFSRFDASRITQAGKISRNGISTNRSLGWGRWIHETLWSHRRMCYQVSWISHQNWFTQQGRLFASLFPQNVIFLSTGRHLRFSGKSAVLSLWQAYRRTTVFLVSNDEWTARNIIFQFTCTTSTHYWPCAWK